MTFQHRPAITGGGGGGSPGGNDTQVQYNDGGVFAGTANFVVNAAGEVVIGGVTPVAGTKLLLPQENDAVTPTLAFGDGDTGFYENADDFIRISIAGTFQWQWSGTDFIAADVSGPMFRNIAVSSTVPTIIPKRSDVNTGIGSAGDDQLSLISGGVEGIRIDASQLVGINIVPTAQLHVQTSGTGVIGQIIKATAAQTADLLLITDSADAELFVVNETGEVSIGGVTPVAGTKLLLPQENDAVTPTLAFGDGADGIYQAAEGTLRFAVGGANAWRIRAGSFGGGGTGQPAMMHETPSATNPNFVPDEGDTDTGIGRAGTDQLSLITGGVEQVRLDVTGNHVVNSLLDAATGNEVALSLNYTVNKATSGNDTGLLINQTDTASPGTSLIADFQVGGTSQFSVNNIGDTEIKGITILKDGSAVAPGIVFAGEVGANTGWFQLLEGGWTFTSDGVAVHTYNGSGIRLSISTWKITDVGGDVLFTLTEAANAVNGMTITNAATGSGPTLSSNGSDTDIDILISPKGVGGVGINEASPGAQLQVNTSGTGIIGQIIKATAAQTADLLQILDSADADLFVVNATGEVSIGGVTPVAGTKLLLPQEDDAVTPTLAFGDGDTGFYESADDVLQVSIGGVVKWHMDVNVFGSNFSNRPQLRNEDPTPTNPNIIPDAADLDTGIGAAGLDQLSLIAGGVERMRLSSAGAIADDAIGISNLAEGSTARLTTRTTHETHTLTLGATSNTTSISIPSGARLRGVSMNVNTAVVDDGGNDNWSAAFITGSTTTIVTGKSPATNTKVDFMVPDEITTDVTEIQFTPNGGSFTEGVIEIVAYYEELTSLANV